MRMCVYIFIYVVWFFFICIYIILTQENFAQASSCSSRANPCLYHSDPCMYWSNACLYRPNPCLYRHNPCLYRPNPCLYRRNPCQCRSGPCLQYRPGTCVYRPDVLYVISCFSCQPSTRQVPRKPRRITSITLKNRIQSSVFLNKTANDYISIVTHSK